MAGVSAAQSRCCSSTTASLGEPRDTPLAWLHARTRLAAESARVVVVVRSDVAAVLRGVSDRDESRGLRREPRARRRRPGRIDPRRVRSGALDDVDTVIVTPVDALPARGASVARLVAALVPGELRAARFAHGHPVVIRADELRQRYREAPPVALRDVLLALGAACATLPVPADDPAVLVDLDDPHDLHEATGQTAPRFL